MLSSALHAHPQYSLRQLRTSSTHTQSTWESPTTQQHNIHKTRLDFMYYKQQIRAQFLASTGSGRCASGRRHQANIPSTQHPLPPTRLLLHMPPRVPKRQRYSKKQQKSSGCRSDQGGSMCAAAASRRAAHASCRACAHVRHACWGQR